MRPEFTQQQYQQQMMRNMQNGAAMNLNMKQGNNLPRTAMANSQNKSVIPTTSLDRLYLANMLSTPALKPCKCYNRSKVKCNVIPPTWMATAHDPHLRGLETAFPLPPRGRV